MISGLTPKQERFAQKYIETGNASEAYRLAYDAKEMKPETINRAAKELIDNPKITARVAQLEDLQLKRHQVTADRVIAEFAKLAFLDIRKAFTEDGNLKPIHEMDDETAAAISGIEVEVRRVNGEFDEEMEGQPQGGALRRQNGTVARLHKIKLSDKRAALDSLAKTLGLFVDKTEITGKDGGPLVMLTKEQRDAAVAAALAADS